MTVCVAVMDATHVAIAADGRSVNQGGTIVAEETRKVLRFGQMIVAAAGEQGLINEWHHALDQVATDELTPRVPARLARELCRQECTTPFDGAGMPTAWDLTAVIATAQGIWRFSYGGMLCPVVGSCYAIGSGAEAARGAVEAMKVLEASWPAGKWPLPSAALLATLAAMAACRVDSACGGSVHAVSLARG
ncbi:MAG: hypothetical protein AMXMBFR64_04970 [Myxococcales bacterium]